MKTVNHNSLGKSFTGKGFVLVIAGLTGLAPLSVADCTQWDVSGRWGIQQGNDARVTLDLKQNQSHVTGSASYSHMAGNQLKIENGTVDGTLNGSQFEMQVRWQYGETGVYRGSIAPDGKVSGSAYIAEDPNNAARKSTWFRAGAFRCTDVARRAASGVPIEAPRFRLVTKLGVKHSGSEPVPETVPSPKASSQPTISAGSTSVKIARGKKYGSTTITWDGGKDHPYAEVWVKTEGEDERFVVERGKGSQQMTVKPGRNVFMLEDAGQSLATVVVEGRQ